MNNKSLDLLLKNIFDFSGLQIVKNNKLAEVFVHKSILNEDSSFDKSYEQLEFLGDAVIELVISDFLFLQDDIQNEGESTIKRSLIVRKSTLAKISEKMKLDNFVYSGSWIDIILGPERESILADVFESLCGYIYLFMGFDEAKKFIINSLRNEIQHLENLKDIKDSKSILQEILQKKGIDVPVYKLRTISSKDEEISFEAKVYCNNKLLATADGKRKSIAEQKAAEKAIFNLKNSL